jgi:hypothetical protein
MPAILIGTVYYCNDRRGNAHRGDTAAEARAKAREANESYC